MKKFLLICSLAFTAFLSNAQSVSINTDGSTAAPSAMLDVKSTTKGLLIPRMTSAQRTAIPMPSNGLMVYDTDQNKFYYYNGSEWTTISTAGGFSLPFAQTLNTYNHILDLTNQNTGDVIKVKSTDGFGVNASSVNNIAIQAVVENQANTNTSFLARHYGYGTAITAVSEYNHGVLGITYAGEYAGVIGVNAGSGYGVIANSTSGTALLVEGNLAIKGGNTNPSNGAVLTSDATGNAVWKANKIAFRATGINSNFNLAPGGMFKVHFSSEDYDFGNGFAPSTTSSPTVSQGAYTVPVSGVYHLDTKLSLQLPAQENFSATVNILLRRAGVTSTIFQQNFYSGPAVSLSSNSVTLWPSASTDYSFQAGDIVWIEVNTFSNSGTDAIISSAQCQFNGHLVFAN